MPRSFSFRSDRSGLASVLKWIGIVVAALVALIVLTGAALATFGGNWLRGPAERIAQQKTGRALKIDGDLKFGFDLPAIVRVQADGISFANADWGKAPQLLTSDAVEFALSLPSLLSGNPAIKDARARNAAVWLERDAQGRKNWELPGGPSKVTIDRLGIDNGRIAFDDPANRISVRGTVSSAGDAMSFDAKGSYAGQPFAARGTGGPLLLLDDESQPYPFDVEADAGPTHASAKGSVTGIKSLAAVDAKTEIKGGSLDELKPLAGIDLPDTPAYRVSGRVVHEGKAWRFEKFETRIGESRGSGTIQFDASGERPAVTGDIAFGTLNLADLGVKPGEKEERRRLLPDTRLNTERWKRLDADVKLSAQKIVYRDKPPIERLTTRVRLRNAILTLDPLALALAGGQLSGTVKLDGSKDPMRADARIKIAKVAVDRLVPGAKASQVDPGRIDGAIDLAGSGNSIAQILGGADGSVAMLVNGGHVSRLLMEEVGLHLPRIVALKAGGDERVGIRCAAADFQIEDGIMHARTGVFDTTVTRVDAGGDINLRDETLDLTLNPNTKETSIMSLRTPIHIRGTFSKPDIQLEKGPIAAKSAGALALAVANPLLALIPLLETGPGRDSDCGSLLTASRAAEDVKKVPAKPTAKRPAR